MIDNKGLRWHRESIKDNSYFAQISVKLNGKSFEIDARPSDSLAMAVRVKCPIYISEKVFGKTQVLSKPITEDEVTKFKNDLKSLKPNDIIGQLLGGGLQDSGAEDEEKEEDSQEGEEEDDEQT